MTTVGIVGAGIAGALLGRRLAAAGARVTVYAGRGLPPDATAVSGGLTRGFEPDLERCRLAGGRTTGGRWPAAGATGRRSDGLG